MKGMERLDWDLSCKVAVAVAAYAIDKPYTYLIPSDLTGLIAPGMRVMVPFGRGNRSSEGIVLEVRSERPEGKLKWISSVLDEQPVIDQDAIRLALWMREQYFCTVYDAVKAMLPAGLYYSLQDVFRLCGDEGVWPDTLNGKQKQVIALLRQQGGSMQRRGLYAAFGQSDPSRALRSLVQCGVISVETSVQRGVGDKTEEIAMLSIPAEEAQKQMERSRSKLRKSVVDLLAVSGSASEKEIRYFTGAGRRTLKELEKNGVITLFQREVFRRPEPGEVQHQDCPVLNQEQSSAFEGLARLMEQEEPACALLYGVTGSGKTEVYISLIHRLLKSGKSAIVLVPEIGLTPQLLSRFSAQFGEQVAVLHSSLSAGERYDEWKRAKQGEARVVIGTRSAVFAPLPRLGLVILDEEQEASYKSEQSPRYHARDVAKYRCAQTGALLVLGSATPGVESMYYAKNGRYHLFSLQKRYNGQTMPQVTIADLRQELRQGNASCLSTPLREALAENLSRGEQSILLLNRRGTSRMVLCTDCAMVPECPRCSVKLTYHKANRRLMCHYCGHSQPLPERCPSCGGTLSFVGVGTQMVEEELQEAFPGIGVLRMDTDTISAAHTHRQLLERFQQERIPVLIGTQMVAKGLDFGNVTLAGVINADLSLFVDDFRASERTFSLLTQVVGRAGRGERPGRAVIQTYVPKHEVIRTAAAQDYESFYQREIALRRELQFPPWSDLVVFTVSGTEEGAVLRGSLRLRNGLETWQQSKEMADEPFRILGPAPAGVVRVNGRYRYRVTVCGTCNRNMRRMTAALLRAASEDRQNRNLSVSADVNPMD